MNISSNKNTVIALATCLSVLLFTCFIAEAKCRKGCNLALASYYVSEGSNLTYISKIFNRPIPDILPYNPHVPNPDSIQTGTRLNIPFPCECLNGDFLGHTFHYITQRDDTYSNVARFAFANLTTDYWIQRVNVYDPIQVPDSVPINVTVNCSCGDHHVSRDYGLFATYPLRAGESLQSLAAETGVPGNLLERFNEGLHFSPGSGIVFLPAKDLYDHPIKAKNAKKWRCKKKGFLIYFFGFLVLNLFWVGVESQCSKGCQALASYYIWDGANLTFISTTFSTTVNNIVSYNPQITNPDLIRFGTRLNVPFSCGCINSDFMGHQFIHQIRTGNTYQRLAELYYSNLTTVEMLTRFNSYPPESLPPGAQLNVTVNCSCGNSRVSKAYGLFITYPLRPGESLSSVANEFSLPERLLQDYNPGVDFSSGSGLVFVPGKDQNGTYPPLPSSSSGISGGAIAGISVAAVIGALSLGVCVYFVFYRRKRAKEESFLQNDQSIENAQGLGIMEKTSEMGPLVASASPKLKGITVDKSVEFTYEELAVATDNFNMSHKIGAFGAVYYAELRGEKAAVKKWTCKQPRSSWLNSSQHLRGKGKNNTASAKYRVSPAAPFCLMPVILIFISVTEPLPWSRRLQIALDSARGLEYIHEHTVPVYIHRDIKSANILIDKNFRAKVADFGLTKLTEVGSASLQTRLVGTFGYMPPEYAQYGDVSPKIDVYAFGVVLYELISAKEAIVKTNEVTTESKGLVALFEDAFDEPDQTESLRKLVDPRLGDDYPFDSVSKVTHLAKACTHENPQLRPSMRSIVVALMTLSSSTEDWDIGSFYENQGLVHLMSGR
ncbi:LysM domain receptor-like kinase [Sesamum angolense]|uniref:LysM domain receptor-like kinase n=1 Tax=Sesamum angolense TaxID=2727404 RepID=A0AAE2BIM4_9LAMI|nr:LysM domain receptor-like kinase [Sesamum angolense]